MVWLIVVVIGLFVALLIALWRRERNSRAFPNTGGTDSPEAPTQPGTGAW